MVATPATKGDGGAGVLVVVRRKRGDTEEERWALFNVDGGGEARDSAGGGYRHYVVVGSTNPWPTISFLLCFTFASLAFTLAWQFAPPGRTKALLLVGFAVMAIAILQAFQVLVPQAREPEFWGVPLMPWIPSISIFLNLFLLGSLDGPSYIRFGFFSVLAVLIYVLYSVHASFDTEENGDLLKVGDRWRHPEENSDGRDSKLRQIGGSRV